MCTVNVRSAWQGLNYSENYYKKTVDFLLLHDSICIE